MTLARRSIAEDLPLTIAGAVGRGKTALMRYIDAALTPPAAVSSPGRPWLAIENWWTAAEAYCDDVKRAWNYEKQFDDWGPLYAPEGIASACKRLFLDDLGVERPTDQNLDSLSTLLSDRCLARRPTWITTNLHPSEFKTRYGERIYSRLHELNLSVVLRGVDRRMAPRAS